MSTQPNFLCELGTEEIPAGYLPGAIGTLRQLFEEGLKSERIDFGSITVYATPRRLAVLIDGLAAHQREEEVEVKGPAVKAAYDAAGKPTGALLGFMKANSVELGDLVTKESGKGEYVFARKKLAARQTKEIIPALVEKVIRDLPFPKRMRWSDKAVTFPRPIDYIVLMLGGDVIPFEVDGIRASNKTRGHYIQHNRMLEIANLADYVSLLRKNSVIIDQAERKRLIAEGLVKAAAEAGGRVKEDEQLLDTVTFLVEDPHVVVCAFDPAYLEIPDIVLIAEMREHQKYFAVLDAAGKLTDRFLVVANNPATDHIRAGNQRVVTARFNDARFFYNEDRKRKLADRVEELKSVLFHKELGSIYDKIQRMLGIATVIADTLSLAEQVRKNINRAVLLSKTDLETAMVYEFSSLQGAIGRIYALHDGEDPDVAAAIEEHYRPRFQGDPLPTAMVPVVVSIAEKLDNIFGSFSVGNIPKGSADPYALRRQSNAIVEILIQNGINLSLREVLEQIASRYRDGASLVDKIADFIAARVKSIYVDRGLVHDEIDACLSTASSDYLELFRRAQSLHEFRQRENFSAMLLSFKRMNNIVSAFRKENPAYKLSYDPAKTSEKAEKDLYAFFDERADRIGALIAASNYIELFELLIEGKAIIDAFFDKVLVMDKDLALRDNRLFKLESILQHFAPLMDFSKISDKERPSGA